NRVPLPSRTSYPQRSQRSYYIDALIDQLEHPDPTDLSNPANALGKTKTEARNRLYRGGLRIYTNDDPLMEYVANLAIINAGPKDQSKFTAALVAIDNH